MEELLRIRGELAGLRSRRTEALWRAFLGLEPDLSGAYRAHGAAIHDEAPRVLEEALGQAGSDEERAGLLRLRAAVRLERVRAAGVELEEGLLTARMRRMAQAPEEALPLLRGWRQLVVERQRGRRDLLSEACARAEAEDEGRRADWIALQQEALAREGASPALLAGFDSAALVQQAREVLASTEDAFRELLPWALSRWVGEDLQPLPRGDLAEHDLAWLQGAAFLGGVFPAGALRLATTGLVEAMGFDSRRRGIRLDLERRPDAAMGAFVAPQLQRRQVVLSLAPLGTPSDWRELLAALPRALRQVSIAQASPAEDVWAGDPAPPAAFGRLFASLVGEPLFYRKVLQAPRGAGEEAARAFTLLALLELRAMCGRALYEQELWSRAPSRSLARAYGELLAEATGARHDERLYLHGAEVALPASNGLRGLALAGVLEPALLERCNEDWWRNPRTGPLLQGLWARGGAMGQGELQAALGLAQPSLGVWAARLLSRL